MDPIHSALYRYLLGRSTPRDRIVIEKWAGDDPVRRELLSRLADRNYVARRVMRQTFVPVERPMEDMRRRMAAVRRRTMAKIMSAAAVAAVLFGVMTLVYFKSDSGKITDQLSAISSADSRTRPEGTLSLESIKHGTTQARLSSGSGGSLELSAADTAGVDIGILMAQKRVERSDVGQLCLDVPRGGEFKIVLEDSTEVWLNSETTLMYPETFLSTERRVRLKGEAYFKVRSDAARPFYVDTDEQTVRVYGTSFNIRAYSDEPCVYTTLETGSISIARSGLLSGELLMSPGHQALLDRSDMKLNMRVVDPKIITSWRNGRFVFEEQPLSAIMRDLSRWYDFRYEFSEPELEKVVFMGSIPRYADFTTAISILEKCGGLRFSAVDGKVVVSSW